MKANKINYKLYIPKLLVVIFVLIGNHVIAQTEFEDVTINSTTPFYSSTNSSINNIFAPMRRTGKMVLGIPTLSDLQNFRNDLGDGTPFDFSDYGSRNRFLNSKFQIVGDKINITNTLDDTLIENTLGGSLSSYINYENIGFSKAYLTSGGLTTNSGLSRILYGLQGVVHMDPSSVLDDENISTYYYGGSFSANITKNVPDEADVQVVGIYTELNTSMQSNQLTSPGLSTAILASDNTTAYWDVNTLTGTFAGLFGGRVGIANRVGIGLGAAFGTTHMLHVDGTDMEGNNLGRVLRLTGLTRLDSMTVLTINLDSEAGDEYGGVHYTRIPIGDNIQNTCTTANWIPKQDYIDSTKLSCSQIYDNYNGDYSLKTVSIGFSDASTRSYSYTQNPQLQGNTAPPSGSNRVVRLDVNGVIRANSILVTSDKRLKKNIESIKNPISIVSKLNGYTYNWDKSSFKSDKIQLDDSKQIGFLAQELEGVIPEAVFVDGEGTYSVNYTTIIPVLSEAIKQQQQQIEILKAEINEIKSCCEKSDIKTIQNYENENIKLYQNNPNPFSQKTVITFFLPQSILQANIVIYDMQGKEVKSVVIGNRNKGSIEIQGNELNAGMYMYALIADGQLIDSKRMVLTSY